MLLLRPLIMLQCWSNPQTLSRRSHTIRMRHEGHEIGRFGLQDVFEIASHLFILLWMSLWFLLPGFLLCSFVKEQNFTAVSAWSHMCAFEPRRFGQNGPASQLPKIVFYFLPFSQLCRCSVAGYFKCRLCFSLKLMLFYSVSSFHHSEYRTCIPTIPLHLKYCYMHSNLLCCPCLLLNQLGMF